MQITPRKRIKLSFTREDRYLPLVKKSGLSGSARSLPANYKPKTGYFIKKRF
ncbi:hypothetical protein BTS2_3774 [Bacillus sp. TS-2]|nr:hypothetical protein BTS2_3774 [Bacillus sp. TS-2]